MDPSAAAAVAAAQQQAMQQQQPLPSNAEMGNAAAAANMAQQQAMWPGAAWPNAGMGWGAWPTPGAHAGMQMPGMEGMGGAGGAPTMAPVDTSTKGDE